MNETAEREPLVVHEVRGSVAHLTLNRPAQYNALSEQMLSALQGALCSRLMTRIQTLPQPKARFAVSGVNVGLFCATPLVALARNIGRMRRRALPRSSRSALRNGTRTPPDVANSLIAGNRFGHLFRCRASLK